MDTAVVNEMVNIGLTLLGLLAGWLIIMWLDRNVFNKNRYYKKDKDKEINDLKEDLNKFKIMVDKNKEVYEKMLDNATESIETFIQNSSEDKILQ